MRMDPSLSFSLSLSGLRLLADYDLVHSGRPAPPKPALTPCEVLTAARAALEAAADLKAYEAEVAEEEVAEELRGGAAAQVNPGSGRACAQAIRGSERGACAVVQGGPRMAGGAFVSWLQGTRASC